MNSNSDNPRVGKNFQLAVKRWFEENTLLEFELEKKIAIGNPAKFHSFDIAERKGRIVVECKQRTDISVAL